MQMNLISSELYLHEQQVKKFVFMARVENPCQFLCQNTDNENQMGRIPLKGNGLVIATTCLMIHMVANIGDTWYIIPWTTVLQGGFWPPFFTEWG
jgi:hypothetical protein